MPWAPASLSRGMITRTVDSSMMVLTASHSSSLSVEMVGLQQRRQLLEHGCQIVTAHVQHQPHLAQSGDGALEQHGEVFELVPLLRVLPGVDVGDELGVRLEHRLD